MLNKIKFNLFYPNYFSFLVNGAMVLILGSVLPYIIQEAKISYSIAGLLLSTFAIGNFLASFVNPFLSKFLNRKASIVITSILQPLCLFGITLIPPVPVLIGLFLFLGISRGCYSIINNAYLNEKGDGSPFAMNILHASFATGAFLSPSILALLFKLNFAWRDVLYLICAFTVISIFMISRLRLSPIPSKNESKSKAKPTVISTEAESVVEKSATPFFKMPVFWISGFILFFYLGVENCVNGWFVTYFKNMGIMSETFANELVSFTWAAVLVGRIVTAIVSTKLSKRTLILIDCIAAAVFFILMISTKNLVVITISIVGLGFFLAGIYPTGVSNARSSIKGSDFGTSMFLAISALGGIIAPQIVGSVADKIGLVGAIFTLFVNVSMMIVLSIINFKLKISDTIKKTT